MNEMTTNDWVVLWLSIVVFGGWRVSWMLYIRECKRAGKQP